jgi:hypothetical protein
MESNDNQIRVSKSKGLAGPQTLKNWLVSYFGAPGGERGFGYEFATAAAAPTDFCLS